MNRYLKGVLSKKQIEMIERNAYLRQEYGQDIKDEWYYGDESIMEIHSEWDSLSKNYYIEDYER